MKLSGFKKHIRIFIKVIKLELMTDMQYRLNFVFSLIGTSAWLMCELLFIHFLLGKYGSIAGWGKDFIILLVGFNQLWVGGMYFFMIWPSLTNIADAVRNGTADRIFTLPLNTRFYVSIFKIDWTSLSIVLDGLIIIIFILLRSNYTISFINIVFSIILLAVSCWIIYCMHFISMCASFWIQNAASIMYFVNVLDRFTRYPYEVFTKGILTYVFTFIIPIVLISNVPLRAFLGILDLRFVLYSLITAFIFTVVSQIVWKLGLRRYESSGS